MRVEDQYTLSSSPWFQPLRVTALAALLALAVAVTGAGVLIGQAVQTRLEAKPTTSQASALEHVDRQGVAAVDPRADGKRGPNRADLGGGRAALGTAR